MPEVTLFDGTTIPAIGLGTWDMCGGMEPDYSQDSRALAAMEAALEMGYSHIDTAEMYANGHTEELVGQAIKKFDREQLFITTKVRPPNMSYEKTHASIDGSLKRMGIEVIDLYLIHWPGDIDMAETLRAMNEAVQAGKIRYLGVSNFDVPQMEEARRLSQAPIVTNQVPYSVATRRYAENGVVDYCQANNIVLTAYSPVEVGKLKIQNALKEVAGNHGATPYQIALTWLVQQPWVITIPMSHNPSHLRQNLEAAEIRLSDDEMAKLNALA